MSFNPVRAKNFYKNPSRRRRPADPRAGTKHSDIMRRQGVGLTVPGTNRFGTGTGFASDVFKGKDFTVRSEVLHAGNATGFGFNQEGDRVYQVMRGNLFITVGNDEGGKDIVQIQTGGQFVAPRGMQYNVATSTEDVELLIIETAGYDDTWDEQEPGVARPVENPTQQSAGPATPTTRRLDQTKAKQQAVAAARQTARRRGRRPAPKVAAGPTPAVQGGGGATTQTGSSKLGRNTTTNANSGNVTGVSPMPGGPGAFRD